MSETAGREPRLLESRPVSPATESELPDGLHSVLRAAAVLAGLMTEAGYKLYLVGGVVRDTLLGCPVSPTGKPDALGGGTDIDCTTDARPADVLHILAPVASSVWTQGRRFGTVGCVVEGRTFEITTHRAESYDPASRKPAVVFGTDLIADLHRRDFTVNAIAVDAADGRLIDPCGGCSDLEAGILRTPLEPETAFAEDPLRMLRAARYIASHRFEPDKSLLEAVAAMGDRLSIVSKERIRDELQKLLLLGDPTMGFRFLARAGLLASLMPGSPARLKPGSIDKLDSPLSERIERIERIDRGERNSWSDEQQAETLGRVVAAVDPDPGLRWAALLAGFPVPIASAHLRDLRVPRMLIQAVRSLLNGSDQLRLVPPDEPYVRRLVHAYPAEMDRVVELVRAVAVFRGESASVADRFQETLNLLREKEDLTRLDPPITGTHVMRILNIQPGPRVGRALAFLSELAFDQGPLSVREATSALLSWEDASSQPAVG